MIGILFKVAEESHPFIEKLSLTDKEDNQNIDFSEIFLEHDEEGNVKEPGFYHY